MQQLSTWSPTHAYVNKLDAVIELLSTNSDGGLSGAQVRERLATDGLNAVARMSDVRPYKIAMDQFRSSVVVLLLVAASISSALGEWLQTIGIIVAVFVNAFIGFITEYRAKVSLEKLSKLAGAVARVRRGGIDSLVPTNELVRGDLLLLEPGDRVPADCRLVEAHATSVDESILTGESLPVWKGPGASHNWEEAVLFQGTSIASGRARAVVIATGSDTRLGALAVTTAGIDNTATPLQNALDKLGRHLTWMTCAICVVVAAVGIFVRGLDPLRMLETSVALAVAAIPEGLPVVATLALAIGIGRMVRRKAIVRRLTAVETLGCTSAICTDKTGTLTENKMCVRRAVTLNGTTAFEGTGYDTTGKCDLIQYTDHVDAGDEQQRLMIAAALCNDASLQQSAAETKIAGDPTEAALLVAARKASLAESELQTAYTRIVELPFDLQRKRMSTVHATPSNSTIVFCKGSPESVLPLCTTVSTGNSHEPLTMDERSRLMQRNVDLAASGLRVLAFAEKTIPTATVCIDPSNLESDLTLLGFIGMADTIREGIEHAIASCKQAGIQIVMLTGDQQSTAEAVARNIGISQVLARVTPEMKLEVVRDLQSAGNVVAMTGDGVNDAPAMKQSDIGVAMGKAGSDLARDASDLVITDDNFATIVAAIEEGRAIYRNIKRAVAYLLTASIASVLVVAIGILVDSQLLLTPLQLLWLNLIMHVSPGIGLVLQRDGAPTMQSPPRSPNEAFLNYETWTQMLTGGTIIALAVAFLSNHRTALAIVCLSLLLQSWRGLRSPFNLPMCVSSAIGVSLVLAATYMPGLRDVLQTHKLTGQDWTVSLLVSVGTFIAALVVSKLLAQFQPKGGAESASKPMKNRMLSAKM